MDMNSVSPLPPPDAPLAMMDDEKTPPSSEADQDIPPPPSAKRYDEDLHNEWDFCSWCEYLIVVILSTILLVAATVLTLIWVLFYQGGFGWSDNILKFNLHPVMMVAGFITLSGFSILLYRLCRCLKHIYVKLIHMFFHVLAIPCAAFGFFAVFDSQGDKGHFNSLHTWLGLATLGIFVIQFVVGFFTFMLLLCCETRTYSCRSVMVPLHASFGLAIFMLAVATCLTGLVEHGKKKLADDTSHNDSVEHLITNVLGIILIVLGITISVAVRRSNAPASAKVTIRERLQCS